MNKFEQVSSGDHQMSIAAGYPRSHAGVGIPCPMSGEVYPTINLSNDTCGVTPVNRHMPVKTLPSRIYCFGR